MTYEVLLIALLGFNLVFLIILPARIRVMVVEELRRFFEE